MKTNKKIDNKTAKEIQDFISDEILAGRIWIFSGIAISILLCTLLKDYMIFELDNIVQPIRKLELPDVKGIFLIVLFALEILFSFILPKILINKPKKNMKSALTALSLIMGLILAVTGRETRTSKTAFQLFRKKRKALQFLDKYGIIVSIICRVL